MSNGILHTQFQDSQPFDFKLLNDQFEPSIFITSPSSGSGSSLHITISNVSGSNLFLPLKSEPSTDPAGNGINIPGPDDFHFALEFRPGILANISPDSKEVISLEDSTSSWHMSPPHQVTDAGGSKVMIYFSKSSDAQGSQFTFETHEEIKFSLSNLRPLATGGARTSVVKLVPGDIFRSADNNAENQVKSAPSHPLRIINHIGNPHMPIHAGFVGSNVVINDNNNHGSNYTLTLRLTNTSTDDIDLGPDYKFTFQFDGQDSNARNPETEAWMLGMTDNIKVIALSQQISESSDDDVHITIDPDEPRWVMEVGGGGTPLKILDQEGAEVNMRKWSGGQSIDLIFDLANFATHFKEGITFLHFTYQNIKGYWDRTLNIPLEKRPLLIKVQKENDENDQEHAVIDSGLRPLVFKSSQILNNRSVDNSADKILRERFHKIKINNSPFIRVEKLNIDQDFTKDLARSDLFSEKWFVSYVDTKYLIDEWNVHILHLEWKPWIKFSGSSLNSNNINEISATVSLIGYLDRDTIFLKLEVSDFDHRLLDDIMANLRVTYFMHLLFIRKEISELTNRALISWGSEVHKLNFDQERPLEVPITTH